MKEPKYTVNVDSIGDERYFWSFKRKGLFKGIIQAGVAPTFAEALKAAANGLQEHRKESR